MIDEEPPEVWVTIEEAPNYAVSSYGRVKNLSTDRIIRESRTKEGVVKVSLYTGERRITRSVKTLVADAFVEEFRGREYFDTAMCLDNNQENLHASNIVWRPRWFACKYAYQLNAPKFDVYKTYGPYRNLDTGVIYSSAATAAMDLGLICFQIVKSSVEGTWVFPSYHVFEYYRGDEQPYL